MKRTLLALAITFTATTSNAGNLSDPIVAPEVVIAETVKSAGNDDWVLGLMLFAVFIMAGMK